MVPNPSLMISSFGLVRLRLSWYTLHLRVTSSKIYRVSFRLVCDFLMNRVKYAGQNLQGNGNCQSQSKFNLIIDWDFPTNASILNIFFGLVMYYHRYLPYLETRIILSCALITVFLDYQSQLWRGTLDGYNFLKISRLVSFFHLY